MLAITASIVPPSVTVAEIFTGSPTPNVVMFAGAASVTLGAVASGPAGAARSGSFNA